jgi:allophanate hydrolase
MEELRVQASHVWNSMDALLLPTTPTIYRIDEVLSDPVNLNARLGRYTNFVNLFDYCALAIPAGFRSDGLPFGITLLGPAHAERRLARVARKQPASLGSENIQVAVVGAHLAGEPLNFQLTERNASLIASTTTARKYRLFALPTTPPKPGLLRVADGGSTIAVEVWEMPMKAFGSFVAGIPHPLGIGTIELADGGWVKGFICEQEAVEGAPEITHFGGWRAYREASLKPH